VTSRRESGEKRVLAERPNYPGRIIGGTAFLVLSVADVRIEPRQRCEVLIDTTVMPLSFNVSTNISKVCQAIELDGVDAESEIAA